MTIQQEMYLYYFILFVLVIGYFVGQCYGSACLMATAFVGAAILAVARAPKEEE